MRKTIGILAIVACAGIAQASSSTTVPFTVQATATFSNKASIDAQGDVDNARDTWISTYTGPINGVRVAGSLTEVNTSTYASEARVRVGAGFGFRDLQATSTGAYTGTLAIGPTTLPTSAFNLVSGETVNFEWFESYQDSANLAESTWDSVTYEFGFGGNVVTNGSAALGSLAQGSTTNYAGSHVSGGLDFITFTIGDDVAGGGYLNISMLGGATGGMTDTEIALYDGAGNFVAEDDDGAATGYFSMLSYGEFDPFAGVGTDGPGDDGFFLPAGTYTLVTGGYNTSFASTLGGTFVPGTNAGSYDLSISYLPTPGALALLGLGGLITGRRRR